MLTRSRKVLLIHPKYQNLHLLLPKPNHPGDAVAPRWIYGSKNMKWRTTRKSTIGLDAVLKGPRITTRATRMSGVMIAE